MVTNKEFRQFLWTDFYRTFDEYLALVRDIARLRGRHDALRRFLKAQGIVVTDSPPPPSDGASR